MRAHVTSDVVDRAARHLLLYLSQTDAPPARPADAVIGFGVFDLNLPRFCAGLHAAGLARRIIFTGGIGGGTGDLGGPEADVWREEVRRTHPEIPDTAFILESRSGNTAENVRFTAQLLEDSHPELRFGQGLVDAIIVASPSRIRRARLTLQKLQPQVRVVRMLPPVVFGAEQALYSRQGVDYLEHLVGEVDRLLEYPRRGWIAAEPVPADVLAAAEVVRTRGHG